MFEHLGHPARRFHEWELSIMSQVALDRLADGRDSQRYLAHMHELENEAGAAKRGASAKAPSMT